MQALWEIEEQRRTAEAKADDLPRVRLVIEHRRFARDPSGKPLTVVESTGREEVLLELFENEAPRTVANFVELVSSGFYDGTKFHLAVPASSSGAATPTPGMTIPATTAPAGPAT